MIHDPRSLRSFYKRMISLRRQYRVFQVGSLSLLDERNNSVLAFKREFSGRSAYVLLNFSADPAAVSIPGVTPESEFEEKVSNMAIAEFNAGGEIVLMGNQALILIGK